MNFYHTIGNSGQAEFKEKGSRFLAYAFSIKNKNDFKDDLEKLKKDHPKASHYCFAYRIGYDGNNFRVSDDGEPSGEQILSQIDAKQLCDVLVIVVRYFGGTLLGISGLVNAYKTATTLALQCTPILQIPVEKNYILTFNYHEMNDVMHILKQYNCTIHNNETQLFCKIKAGIPVYRLPEISYALQNILNLEMETDLTVPG
jgi:uncharacterized YigZ family protein